MIKNNLILVLFFSFTFMMMASCSWLNSSQKKVNVEEKDKSPIYLKQKSENKQSEIKISRVFDFVQLKKGYVAETKDFSIENKIFDKDLVLKDLLNLNKQVSEKESTIKRNAIQTSIFLRKLNLIEEKVVQFYLIKAANKQGERVQDYIDKNIYQKINLTLSEEDQEKDKVSKKFLVKRKKEKAIRYFVRNYLLKEPIRVSLKRDFIDFDWDFQEDISWGNKESKRKILVFFDYKQTAMKEVFLQVFKIKNIFDDVFVLFRPLIDSKDRFQSIWFNYLYCAWEVDKGEKFKSFFLESLGSFKDKIEVHLKKSEKKFGFDLARCVSSRSNLEKMTRFLKKNELQGLVHRPYLILNGQVYYSTIDPERMIDLMNIN